MRETITQGTPVHLDDAFATIPEPWQPRLAGRVNGTDIKLVKLDGDFIWHHHETEDEMFLVLSGVMRMKFRDRDEVVPAGSFIIVPAGVEHCPVTDQTPCHVMLVEPAGVRNTGNVENERTFEA